MLSTPLGFILGLSLHNATPQFMCLKFILALISAEAHSFLLVHYVSDFLFWGVAPCAFLIGFLGWIARFGDQLFSWSVCYAPLRASTMIFFPIGLLLDGCTLCWLWLLLWLSVTSSFELRQPKLKVFMSMACDAMVCDACRSEANACTCPPCWSHSSCSVVYVMFFPFNFHDLWHASIF